MLTQFKSMPFPAYHQVREIRAIKDGADPLAGLKARHVGEASLIARRGDERVLVVLAPYREKFLATLYWGAKPQEVLESLKGTRKFCDLSGEKWEYDQREMTIVEAYALLARLAAGDQDI